MSSGDATSMTACILEASSSSTRRWLLGSLPTLTMSLCHRLASDEIVALVEPEREGNLRLALALHRLPFCVAQLKSSARSPSTPEKSGPGVTSNS